MASGTANAASAGEHLFVNGKILHRAGTGRDATPVFAESMLIRNGTIAHIGPRNDLAAAAVSEGTTTHDLAGRTVLPGFIDGHMHLLLLGQALHRCGGNGELKCQEGNRAACRFYMERGWRPAGWGWSSAGPWIRFCY